MTLIVENGSGVANANSYASVAQADARLLVRGNADWDALDTDAKEMALILATDYMTSKYRLRWSGYRALLSQSLDWPRFQVPIVDAPGIYAPFPAFYPINTVPTEVVNATIDLALRSSQGTVLQPDLDQPVQRETVGPITTVYFPGARMEVLYSAIDGILAPFLVDTGSGNQIALSRG